MSAKSAEMERLLKNLAFSENRVMKVAEEIRELAAKEAKQYQPEPSRINGDRFVVSIQYAENGTVYQYLVLRNNGRWYTTAVSDSSFASWEKFIDWLERPEVYWHSSLSRLRPDRVSTPALREYLRQS